MLLMKFIEWVKQALADPKTGGPSTSRIVPVCMMIIFGTSQAVTHLITAYVAYVAPEHLDKLSWLPTMSWGTGTAVGLGAGMYAANVKWGATTEETTDNNEAHPEQYG